MLNNVDLFRYLNFQTIYLSVYVKYHNLKIIRLSIKKRREKTDEVAKIKIFYCLTIGQFALVLKSKHKIDLVERKSQRYVRRHSILCNF